MSIITAALCKQKLKISGKKKGKGRKVKQNYLLCFRKANRKLPGAAHESLNLHHGFMAALRLSAR